MITESTYYHDPEDKGFPLTPHEEWNFRCWGPPSESQIIVNILKKWNLTGAGIVLWLVKNMDKPYSKWTKQQSVYIFPEDEDRLIQNLANLSLGNTIILLEQDIYVFNVYVGASENGETNIDADVLEEFSNAFRR